MSTTADGATPGDFATSRGSVTRRSRKTTLSCFDPSFMPSDSIYQRKLHQFSVHFSVATSQWVATLVRPTDVSPMVSTPSNNVASYDKRNCSSFNFASEREARKFGKAYSPPKMMTDGEKCFICSSSFSRNCSRFNCRNCGANICEKCSARWGIRMIPRTYYNPGTAALTVRVCKSCDWLVNGFCMSLLKGQYENALIFYETGNVNVRCSFADINKEAM